MPRFEVEVVMTEVEAADEEAAFTLVDEALQRLWLHPYDRPNFHYAMFAGRVIRVTTREATG